MAGDGKGRPDLAALAITRGGHWSDEHRISHCLRPSEISSNKISPTKILFDLPSGVRLVVRPKRCLRMVWNHTVIPETLARVMFTEKPTPLPPPYAPSPPGYPLAIITSVPPPLRAAAYPLPPHVDHLCSCLQTGFASLRAVKPLCCGLLLLAPTLTGLPLHPRLPRLASTTLCEQ